MMALGLPVGAQAEGLFTSTGKATPELLPEALSGKAYSPCIHKKGITNETFKF